MSKREEPLPWLITENAVLCIYINIPNMGVKVRMKDLANGRISFFLDMNHNRWRRFEHLGLHCKKHPQTQREREEKKMMRELAEEIAAKRWIDIIRDEYQVGERFETSSDFAAYMQAWIEQHKDLLDIRMYISALAKLIEFVGREKIPCFDLTEVFWKRFATYLQKNLNGSTPNSYLKKLKRVVKAATEDKHFKEDPAKNVSLPARICHQKATLTTDEIQLLWSTECRNDEVRRAFTFSCFTGLRFCDVKHLKWKDVIQNKLEFIQRKTKVQVSVTLRDETIALLGQRGKSDDCVFNLLSHTGCLNVLKQWCEDAGIIKHITWHCARHSFATNLNEGGANPLVTSKLMGHTSMKYTQNYIRVSDEQKEQAINTLPQIR